MALKRNRLSLIPLLFVVLTGAGTGTGVWAGASYPLQPVERMKSETPTSSHYPGDLVGRANVAINAGGTQLGDPPVAIGGTVFEDWRANGALEQGDVPIEEVRVYLDLNEDGVLTPGTPTTYTDFPNLPFGADPAQVTSIIPVTGLTGIVEDVEVLFNINHTWVGDVRIELTAPDGQTMTLLNQAGGGLNNGQNFAKTWLADWAETSIQSITPAGAPYTGSYRPAEPFALLFGAEPNGDWTLTVTDLFPVEDDGVLLDWALILYSDGEPFVLTNAQGNYQFVGLDAGSYVVRAIAPEAWIGTAPAAGSHTVIIEDPDSSHPDLHFGYYRPDAIYGRTFQKEDSSGTSGPEAPGLAGLTVYLDLDDDGELAELVQLEETRNPALPIPDNNEIGISDTIVIAGLPGFPRVEELLVEVTITHPFVGDLQVFLQAPDGEEIILVNRRGGNGDNFTGTIFDDQAALPISEVTAVDAPFTGSFRPETPLSTLRGSAANGAWSLRVADRAGQDTGTFESWTLTVVYAPEPFDLTNADGNYRLDRGLLPAGPYRVRVDNSPADQLTFPVGGSYLLTYPDDDSLHEIDFGLLLDTIFSNDFEAK